jgi:KDO2-lipid IV(A) lauroyltransferase
VLADDTSFPELYDLLRRQREAWGIKVIGWRNLRGIYEVLRRREMLALLIDWGYRADGIPVQLFGAWTTIPAGPATLAARTGSRIVSITIGRRPDGKFGLSWSEPIEVASSDPAELQRASQAMADGMAATIAAAPAQWYSFKPMWPASPEEAADLERRARLMEAGRPDPGHARNRPIDPAELEVERS